ncbi:MAG: metal-dependent hydrolase, partial [Gammaproteobacteria bacterium]|nr:metal-dependent hydrolase [Gammaproteobacteria bacterium]
MSQSSYQYLRWLPRVFGYGATEKFVLFGFRKNRSSYSSRSALIHSYGYASADDRTDYLARFPMNSGPFMKYPGKVRIAMNVIKPLLSCAFAAMIFVAIGNVHAFELQWFGQSAVKITTDDGKIVVIDPFITKNPKTPDALKDLGKLGKVDLILLTHGHGDHVGDTAELARMTGAKVAMNADMGHTFGTLGIVPYEQLIRFNKSGSIQPFGAGITVTMVHAEHSSEVVHEDAESGVKRVYPGGEPVGYIIQLESGFIVYHAGDTGVFGDMAFIGEYYRPDLALLPIGGHITMDPAHAAYAVRHFLKPQAVLPIHYGTFPPLKGTPEQFAAALGEFPVSILLMAPGD